MSEHNPEVSQPSDDPQHKSETEADAVQSGSASVEFHIEDTNHDYAKGVFMRNARELQSAFADLYREDPQAHFRLTLERL